MDLDKFEKMAKLVLKDLEALSSSFSAYPIRRVEFKNLMILASKALPDYDEFFKTVRVQLNDFDRFDAKQAVKHILRVIEIEKASKEKIEEMKIFESADEKLKQANLSFQKEDHSSVFHNLNTALELVLKDKLGIPITIIKINTSRIIDILVKHRVEPHLYLAEAKKRVVMIDNKVKHQGYKPSKIDCINGIKAMEELISRLRNKEIKLTEDIRNKIYEGL